MREREREKARKRIYLFIQRFIHTRLEKRSILILCASVRKHSSYWVARTVRIDRRVSDTESSKTEIKKAKTHMPTHTHTTRLHEPRYARAQAMSHSAAQRLATALVSVRRVDERNGSDDGHARYGDKVFTY